MNKIPEDEDDESPRPAASTWSTQIPVAGFWSQGPLDVITAQY